MESTAKNVETLAVQFRRERNDGEKIGTKHDRGLVLIDSIWLQESL